MKLGTETGSLINHVMTSGGQVQPEVGMGATVCHWSDRHAGTIVKVTATQIHVQGDKAVRIDKNGMSESQQYEYHRNPEAPISVFRKTKRGWRNKSGAGLLIGSREEYYDYSF